MKSLLLSVAAAVMVGLASAGLGAGGAAGTGRHGDINARQLVQAFATKTGLQDAVNGWCFADLDVR
jgi:hypothetical protein